jgi:hypothetical protein
LPPISHPEEEPVRFRVGTAPELAMSLSALPPLSHPGKQPVLLRVRLRQIWQGPQRSATITHRKLAFLLSLAALPANPLIRLTCRLQITQCCRSSCSTQALPLCAALSLVT